MGLIEQYFRELIFILDKAVYWLIESAYNILLEISGVHLLESSEIQSFSERIYLLLGIFMLFKIAVSLINYFLNPDSFNDNKAGMGSLLKRIAVSFVLIITVPMIFKAGYYVQDVILKNELLPAIILGKSENNNSTHNVNSDAINNGGKVIAISLFKGFFYPKNETTIDPEYALAPSDASLGAGIERFAPLIKNEAYEYSIPLSTIGGGLAAWVLVMYCFDVAVRVVKLTFLELISPIPVISYVDPKKGDSIFKKWVSTCTSTYLQVFLYLMILYFVIYLVTALDRNGVSVFDAVTGEMKPVSAIAQVFIILGLLLFMKEAPKMIGDIFGIKLDGGFTLNPLKKLGDNALIGGLAGGIVGAGAGAYANYRTHRSLGHGGIKSTLSAAGGAFTGAARGGAGGFNSKGDLFQDMKKGFESSLYGSRKIAAKGAENNTSFWGRNMAAVQDRFHSQTEADMIDDQIQSYNNLAKASSNFQSSARAEVEKHKGGAYATSAVLKAQLDVLKAQQVPLTDKKGRALDDAQVQALKDKQAAAIVKATAAYEAQMKIDVAAEMDRQLKAYEDGDFANVSAASEITAFNKELREHSSYYEGMGISSDSASSIKAAKDTAIEAAGKLDTAEKTIKARANRDYAKNSRTYGRPGSNKK